jgi:outer membrane immunogenic protein
MRKLLLSAVALVVLAIGPATAADLARKAPAYTPPPPPPQPTWTGWYVGANAGVHWFQNDSIDIGSSPSFNPLGLVPDIVNQAAAGATVNLSGGSHAGFIGGAQFGRNQQWGNWVFGSENDIQGISNNKVNISTTTSVATNNGFPLLTNINATKQLDYLGTARGRLGWLATPTFLVYGTAGLAYGGVKSSVDISQFHGGLSPGIAGSTSGATSGLFDQTLAGWTAGGGVEWLFLPNWSAKVEYLYYDLGNVSYTTPSLVGVFSPNAGGAARYAISSEVFTRFNGNMVRAGVNYHFNF